MKSFFDSLAELLSLLRSIDSRLAALEACVRSDDRGRKVLSAATTSTQGTLN